MGRRKQTKADAENEASFVIDLFESITPVQEKALEVLLAGQTITAAAESAGVTRQTVSEWSNHDPAFVALYNLRRKRLMEEHDNRLRQLMSKAIDAVEQELKGERALEAARLILKAVSELPPITGPITPAEAEIEEAEQKRMFLLRDAMSARWQS